MQTTYIASSNTAANGKIIGNTGQDVVIYKIYIGAPVANGNVYVYNKTAVVTGDTSNIAFKATLPATISSSYSYVYPTVYDFTVPQIPGNTMGNGLVVNGGNVMIDQTMQVTVLWDYLD